MRILYIIYIFKNPNIIYILDNGQITKLVHAKVEEKKCVSVREFFSTFAKSLIYLEKSWKVGQSALFPFRINNLACPIC